MSAQLRHNLTSPGHSWFRHMLVLVLLLGCTNAFAQIDLVQPAKVGAGGQGVAATGAAPARAQLVVSLNTTGMRDMAQGDTARILTPSGTSYRITYQLTEIGFGGGEVWVGYLTDFGNQYPVIISTYQGQVSGTINTPGGKHRLAGATQSATLTDEVAANEPVFVPTADDGLQPPPSPRSANIVAAPNSAAAVGANSQIDIMVLFTNGFASVFGGNAGAIARVNQVVATANRVYANSGIRITLVVAYTGAINYPDNDIVPASTALNDITGYSQTRYDVSLAGTVASLRRQYGADLVSLLREFKSSPSDGACGIAWITDPSNIAFGSQYGFSVEDDVRSNGAAACDGAGTTAGDTGFTHELGHNMGSLHDRATEGNSPGTGYPSYNRGYCNGAGSTVMSYSSSPGCVPIQPYFSSPALNTCNGSSCGVASSQSFTAYGTSFTAVGADSVSAININAPNLAAYMAAAAYTVTPSAGANGTISPSTPVSVAPGATTTFTVIPNAGYIASVGGTCGGSLSGATYTTSAINANCSVSATFTLSSQPPELINWAAASNGGTATASSTYNASFPPSATIDGDHKGMAWGNGGGWNDATAGAFPDWLQINFSASRTINNVTVYTLQDNYSNPIEPTDTTTFSLYGVTAFDVQVFNGSSWSTVASVSGNNNVKRRVYFAPVATTAIRIVCNSALAGFSRIIEVEASYVDNWAAASNGATASASSSYNSSFPPSATIDGDRKGTAWGNGGGWNDATGGAFPDWLQINFNASRTINSVSVYTLQDNYSNPIEPTDTTTFSLYGVTAFDVQVFNGSTWTTVASISGNNNVKRSVYFAPVTTTAIRVVCNNALAGFSRIVEVEARYAANNWAAASSGATASASSSYNSSFPPSATIDGDRKGTAWGNGGGWNDGTAGVFPDWLQINFNATRTISNVTVYTLQDNYSNPIEPTDTTTFSLYGLTAFDVQVFNGSTWTTVASISGNNNVKRSVNFPAVTTTAIRIVCNNALAGFSRITEVEASG